jgi:hypothetical protein
MKIEDVIKVANLLTLDWKMRAGGVAQAVECLPSKVRP